MTVWLCVGPCVSIAALSILISSLSSIVAYPLSFFSRLVLLALALRHVHGLERALLHRVARHGAVEADLGRARVRRRAAVGCALLLLLLLAIRIASVVPRVVLVRLFERFRAWVVIVVLILLLLVRLIR